MGDRERITLAILGLGGQGGGVLANWIVDLGLRNGWVAQGTSVPGVAQRTGATVYYVEMIPASDQGEPVLALTPIPGDVDVVLATELMEAGRAILRGFVSADRTTLIGSTHRVYAISEKSAMGDGRASGDRILAAARERAKAFIGFDMDAASARTSSVISAVIFGALAGSGALPFSRSSFEDAIRASGKAVETNIAGFALGFDNARGGSAADEIAVVPDAAPTTVNGRAMLERITATLPVAAHAVAIEGARRTLDYQDARYGALYLDRLERIATLDNGADDWLATREAARHLALWMSYDDTIRVADLKVRASRMERVRDEVKAAPGQIVHVIEYMHPRLEEICETLPAGIGARILSSDRLKRWLTPMFTHGRHVRTTGIGWFAMLSILASLRRWRRGTLRYAHENARIERWLALVEETMARDPAAAIELIRCQGLIKGYGDTFARGLDNYERIVTRYPAIRERDDAAILIRALREAALADEGGAALNETLAATG